mmetsp:Transcript_10814/g.16489  ORF Transcript_10814/g.16489 Transcript_10814/m.16489 type:complete len:228 (+) Transcript_10814:89-772(+)
MVIYTSLFPVVTHMMQDVLLLLVNIFHFSVRQFPNLDIIIPIRINQWFILWWDTNTISSLSIKFDLIRCRFFGLRPTILPIKTSDNTARAPLLWPNHAFNFISNFESQFTRSVPSLKNDFTANSKTIWIRFVSFQFILIFFIRNHLLLALFLVACLPMQGLALPRAVERTVASCARFKVIRITTLITESSIPRIWLHIHRFMKTSKATETIILLLCHHRNLPNISSF